VPQAQVILLWRIRHDGELREVCKCKGRSGAWIHIYAAVLFPPPDPERLHEVMLPVGSHALLPLLAIS